MNYFQWNDSNIPEDVAVISIVGSKSKNSHYFVSKKDNVLNLEFDDISDDDLLYYNSDLVPFTKEQAIESVLFIKNNIGKDFYIHCEAGKSRSQAFVRFILDYFPKYYSIESTNYRNPCITPNIDVLSKLKRVMIFGEEN